MTPEGFLKANVDRFVDELRAFVRIPSISTDPAYAGSIEEAVRFVAARMESAGLENVAILPTEGHPLVYGDWLHAEYHQCSRRISSNVAGECHSK